MTTDEIKARCQEFLSDPEHDFQKRTDGLPFTFQVRLLESLFREAMAKGLEMATDGLTNDVRLDKDEEVRDNEVGKDGDGTSYNQGIDMCIKWCCEQAKTLKEPPCDTSSS